MLEARGKDKAKELLEHISKVINHTGTKKINSKEIKTKVDGVYFNPPKRLLKMEVNIYKCFILKGRIKFNKKN